MTIQMLNSKAEQALLHMFDSNLGRFPGGQTVQDLRRSAIGAFASKGLPSRRQEEWKYTDLKSAFKEAHPLALHLISSDRASGQEKKSAAPSFLQERFQNNIISFLDGFADASIAARGSLLPKCAFFSKLSDEPPSWISALLNDPILSHSSDLLLNTALFTDGAIIDVEKGGSAQVPYCIFSGARGHKNNIFSALRHFIRIGAGSKVSLIEFDITGQSNANQSSHLSQVVVGDGADVTHIKIVFGRKDSIHLGHCQVRLGANASYRPFHLMIGEGLIRSSLNLNFVGESATFDFAGASVVKGSGHVDSTLVIDHKVPRCVSREHFKAVLDGESKAVFQGKVIVRPDAQKTDGKQMAQALLLSPSAEFDSKPELEIYADDVACGHGSTCAEIDPDLLFYCMSRGIPQEVARSLLIESFVGEVIDKIQDQKLRDFVFETAKSSLGNADFRNE
ncbi:MAG: Fe-S cluster assembly protein SufD [Hyphomicrobium sp.]